MDQQATLSNWWVQGGVVMYPLAIYSILGLAILIEKLTFLRKINGDGHHAVHKAIGEIKSGKNQAPVGDGPIYMILRHLHGLHADGMSVEALIRAAEREVAKLEDKAMRGMIWLA